MKFLPWIPDLSQRNLQPEIMDQPDLDNASHRQALAGLRRINFVSGTVRILWSPIKSLAKALGVRRLRVLDIASGGGDVAVGLWRKARRAGLGVDIVGYDKSPTAVSHAEQLAEHAGTSVRFETRDVLAESLPRDWDIVMSSLFLHHLSQEDAVALLGNMSGACRHLLLINDLRRSLGGYLLAHAACRLLSRCSVVHVDGPRSVAGAFTRREIERSSEEAGLSEAQFAARWPCRFLLTWKREYAAADDADASDASSAA